MTYLNPSQFPKHIFRAYDIRGNLSDLTQDVVIAIAYAFLDQLKKSKINKIVVGYDARLSSPVYAKIIEKYSKIMRLRWLL